MLIGAISTRRLKSTRSRLRGDAGTRDHDIERSDTAELDDRSSESPCAPRNLSWVAAADEVEEGKINNLAEPLGQRGQVGLLTNHLDEGRRHRLRTRQARRISSSSAAARRLHRTFEMLAKLRRAVTEQIASAIGSAGERYADDGRHYRSGYRYIKPAAAR